MSGKPNNRTDVVVGLAKRDKSGKTKDANHSKEENKPAPSPDDGPISCVVVCNSCLQRVYLTCFSRDLEDEGEVKNDKQDAAGKTDDDDQPDGAAIVVGFSQPRPLTQNCKTQ